MPEGDTIYRTAEVLRRYIVAQPIVSVEARDRSIDASQLSPGTIGEVTARGKHLLMLWQDGPVLHSHMGMTGSWHVYRPGEKWHKPQRSAVLRIDCGSVLAICFTPKLLELLSADQFRRHPYLSRLGPDLLAGELQRQEILDRFDVHAQATIGSALMNQTIVCGVGNVYKSEVLFLNEICPWNTVGSLTHDQIWKCLQTARRLMRRNLDGRPRRTRFHVDGHRAWVYGRQGEPCLRCGTRIEMERQGDQGRSTYWCPTCQPPIHHSMTADQ